MLLDGNGGLDESELNDSAPADGAETQAAPEVPKEEPGTRVELPPPKLSRKAQAAADLKEAVAKQLDDTVKPLREQLAQRDRAIDEMRGMLSAIASRPV